MNVNNNTKNKSKVDIGNEVEIDKNYQIDNQIVKSRIIIFFINKNKFLSYVFLTLK